MSVRPMRPLVTLLLTLATLATILGAGARWIDHQVLEPGRWARTSEQFVRNPQVRRAIADFSVRRAFGSGIDSAIDRALPAAVADRVTETLHGAAGTTARGLLRSGPGRRVWREANREAVAGLNRAVDHPRRNEGLVLNLTPLLRELVRSIAGSTVARAIPGSSQVLSLGSPDAGRLVVLSPAQVADLRPAIRTVRLLSWALPALALALFLLSLLIALGWRTVALSAIGYRLLIAGGIVLVARVLLRSVVADAVVGSGVDRAGVRAAWMIGTTTLRTEGIWLLVAGAVVVLASWLLRILTRRRPPIRSFT